MFKKKMGFIDFYASRLMLFKPRYHLPDFFRSDIKFISLSKSVAFETNSFWLNHRVIHFTHAAINTTFFLKIANYEAPVIFDLEKAFCLQQTYLYTRTASWPVWVALASPPVQECSQCPHHWNHGQPPLILLEPLEKKKRPIICPNKPQYEIILLKMERAKRGRRKRRKFLPSLPQLINKY